MCALSQRGGDFCEDGTGGGGGICCAGDGAADDQVIGSGADCDGGSCGARLIVFAHRLPAGQACRGTDPGNDNQESWAAGFADRSDFVRGSYDAVQACAAGQRSQAPDLALDGASDTDLAQARGVLAGENCDGEDLRAI